MRLSDYNKRVDSFKESPTRKIDKIREELASKGKDIILLSTGQPSIPPPKWAREKLSKLLLEDNMKLYGYTPSQGRASTIKAVIQEMKDFGVNLSKNQITLTAGGQSALFSTVLTLFKKGDNVVVFDPMYFGYWPLLEYAEVNVIPLKETPENGFQPPIKELEEILEKQKVKATILVTPDNPTGRVLNKDSAEKLASLAKEHDFWIIVDEAYRTLVYEGEHIYLYNLAPENVISLNAFSKDPGIPGWRLGFVYGPEEVIKKIKLIVGETVYCPPSIAQFLIEVYLEDRHRRFEHIDYVKRVYKEKRDALVKALNKHLPKAKYVIPQGGMFLFADLENILKSKGLDAEEFSKTLLEKKYVATVPGSYFSRFYNYSLRLSFVSETPDRVEEGVRRIAELVNEI